MAARLQVGAVLLAALALRLGQLSRPGLHPDEALYGSWALRIAAGRDPALTGVLVDKPPLLPYLLAGIFQLGGHHGVAPVDLDTLVAAARLAAVGASVVGLILVWAVAHRLYGRQAAFWAAALYAVSPLAVRLSPSLLTDPWLILWMLLGLWAALKGSPWLTGLACGLAYATKQQAVLLIPLILAVYWLSPRLVFARRGHPGVAAHSARSILRLLGGFALIFAVVLWWDSLRWQWMPSFWDRSAEAYGGLRLIQGADVVEHLRQWGELVGYAFGWPLLAVLMVVVLVGLQQRRLHLKTFERLLLGFMALYLLIHLATTLEAWDRYVLPLVPLLALLFGQAVVVLAESPAPSISFSGAARRRHDRMPQRRMWLAALLTTSLAYAAWLASFSRMPAGDTTAYDGVAQIAEHIRLTQPSGAIVYHHWLGWHYGFYLADAPVELRFWEFPADLATKASAGGGPSQWIAFQAGRDHHGPQEALEAAGLRLQPELVVSHPDGTPSIMLFRIVLSDSPERSPATATAGHSGQDALRSPVRSWSPAS